MARIYEVLHTLSFVVADRVRAVKAEETGASAVEYAILVGAIAAAVTAAVLLFGPQLNAAFTNLIP
jgi:pilus assembly protein Flp/PilA